jgi:hypothetical protein
MANTSFFEKQNHAIAACNAVARLKRAGLTDADVTGLADTMVALVTAIKTRRDAVTTAPTMRPAFDLGIFAVQELGTDGVLVDGATVISNLLTVAASPFVAGVATDLLSQAATAAPTTGSFDPAAGSVLITPALGARVV